MKEYKIVIVGNGGVGKSALTVRFVQGQFVHSYDATIEDSYRKFVHLDGEDCRMEILDTAGTEQFTGMRDLYLKNGHGFILVYSIDDPSSFSSVQSIAKTIVKQKNGKAPMIFVGNKSDVSESERCISTSKGMETAKSFSSPFIETSAKTDKNVSEIFFICARQIRLQSQRKKIDNKDKYKSSRCCRTM